MKKLHLIVTFDYPKPAVGYRKYTKIDNILSAHAIGPVYKVFKQVRLITTKLRPTQLTSLLYGVLPKSGSVLICQAARPYRFTLGKSHPQVQLRTTVNSWFSNGAKR